MTIEKVAGVLYKYLRPTATLNTPFKMADIDKGKFKMKIRTPTNKFIEREIVNAANQEEEKSTEPGGERKVNESDYQRQRLNRSLEPNSEGTSFADRLRNRDSERLDSELKRRMAIEERNRERLETANRTLHREDQHLSIRGSRSKWDAPTPEDSGDLKDHNGSSSKKFISEWDDPESVPRKSVSRWDSTETSTDLSKNSHLFNYNDVETGDSSVSKVKSKKSRWDETPSGTLGSDETPLKRNRWDVTPIDTRGAEGETPIRRGRWDSTPNDVVRSSEVISVRKSRWDATPVHPSGTETPSRKSRWDATPTAGQTSTFSIDPMAFFGNRTGNETPSVTQSFAEREMDHRNRFLTDAELDAMLPSQGYAILQPPPGYIPITPGRKITASTPLVIGTTTGFSIIDASTSLLDPAYAGLLKVAGDPDLPALRPEDQQHFGRLLINLDKDKMSLEEAKEQKILRLLLCIKNGQGTVRAKALRELTDRAKDLGAGIVLDSLLPLLMSPSLGEGERHALVKAVDRVLFRVGQEVRPHVHKILVVVEPLLIDEDWYARAEGREIVANLARAAGLPTMLATLRPDIEHADEYVRNTTARTIAVLVGNMGVPVLLPFLKAVCRSRRSWQARHTGLKVLQQSAIILGSAILPHLTKIISECIGTSALDTGLINTNSSSTNQHTELKKTSSNDGSSTSIDKPNEIEQSGTPVVKMRVMAAMAVAACAEAAAPYGMGAFEPLLPSLWRCIRQARGKALAAFLRAAGNILALMRPEQADHYTRDILGSVLIREFSSSDDDLRRIVLRVLRQISTKLTSSASRTYIRTEILPDFFRHFWTRRTVLDRRNARALVDTTVAFAMLVGPSECLSRLLSLESSSGKDSRLKDDSEVMRRTASEVIELTLSQYKSADLPDNLVASLIDGLSYAFTECPPEENIRIILGAWRETISTLGSRMRPHLLSVASIVLWRLSNRTPKIRQAAADLAALLPSACAACDHDDGGVLPKLGVVLFENLGEEYPDVLGSILGALAAVLDSSYSIPPNPKKSVASKLLHGSSSSNSTTTILLKKHRPMSPPVKELLPRLTPILRNRNDNVQENCVFLVGRIAEREPEAAAAREWMRICFELIDMLRAPKRSVRRAAVITFGWIARAIGPHDVITALLSNLRVQERQNRVCTTVAIAIVADQCAPFTVLPSLMAEYRVPELNVQNGVLKALAFLFEYVGSAGRDYVYAVAPLLEDALTDRDQVHRQTATTVLKNMELAAVGFGAEDVFTHLLNASFPSLFDANPHLVMALIEALDAARLAIGPIPVGLYLLPGLFHPARRVRNIYWKLWNNLYLAASPALYSLYPRIPDELTFDLANAKGVSGKIYTRHIMDVFV